MDDADLVRPSIDRHLGIEIAGLIPFDRHVEGLLKSCWMRHKNKEEITSDKLFGWHSALIPTGRSGMMKIVSSNWRNNNKSDLLY